MDAAGGEGGEFGREFDTISAGRGADMPMPARKVFFYCWRSIEWKKCKIRSISYSYFIAIYNIL